MLAVDHKSFAYFTWLVLWNKQTICDRYICLLKADRRQREQQSMIGWKYMRLIRARLAIIVQVTYDNVKDVFSIYIGYVIFTIANNRPKSFLLPMSCKII